MRDLPPVPVPQELMDGIADCRDIDGMVSGAGDPARRKQLEGQMSALVQTIRSCAAQLMAGLQTMAAKRGGYVTFTVPGHVCLDSL